MGGEGGLYDHDYKVELFPAGFTSLPNAIFLKLKWNREQRKGGMTKEMTPACVIIN